MRLLQPSPQLAERLARAIADRHARLVRVETVLTGRGEDGAVAADRPAELASLSPEDVFLRRYRRDHQGDVPAPLMTAFRQLLDQVQHEGTA